ncbi:MAG: hypothetical protein K2H40_10475 [Lachnospiraceae bacterium]|nr:hypothetical protein [Lachnospiraceae bacterium]
MYIRKMLTAATASLLIASLIVMPVSAHGHHGRSKTTVSTVATECPVCTVEDCAEDGHHTHDGVTYCGYEHSGEYCDGSCGSSCGTTTTSSGSHHRRGHGCH